jgi:hypothetical protein
MKVFISQNNFFKKRMLDITKVVIGDANFTLSIDDFKFLNEANNEKLSEKKLKIENSKIFLKDKSNEIITIIKVSNALLFYDNLKLLNLLNLNGSTFNIPFTVNLKNQIFSSRNKELNINAQNLKLSIFDESKKKSADSLTGANIISILNSKIYTNYIIKKNLTLFESDDSRTKNENINYNGRLSFKPFNLDLNIKLKKYDLSKLIDNNSIISELIKTKLLFNENITANFTIDIDTNKNNEIFKSTIINFNLLKGKINLNKSRLINNKIGFLEIKNSNLVFEENKFILKTDIVIEVHDSEELFSIFQTPKKLRKEVKKILMNIDYDLSTNQIYLNNIKVDNLKNNAETKQIIKEINDSNNYNLNKSRGIFNKLLSTYAG